MTTKSFEFDGITFVSGLFWQPLSGATQSERAREVKALSKELQFDLYVMRTTSPCAGFSKLDVTTKRGASSAAAMVSKGLEVNDDARDFIFVSQLPSGEWIYVAQKDGIILAEGDQIYSSEDGARSRLLEDLSLGHWALVIAPKIWGVGNDERSFEDVIPKKANGKPDVHKWWKLQPANPGKAFSVHAPKIVIGCIVVGAAIYGIKYYQHWKAQKAMEEAARLAAIQLNEQGKPVPPEHPWKKIPRAHDVMTACMSAMSSIRLFPGNWTINGVACNNGTFTVSWRPNGNYGWIEHLRSVVPNAIISPDGSLASSSVPLAELPVGIDEEHPGKDDRMVAMHSAAQRYGVSLKVEPPPAPPPPLPGQEGTVAAKDWSEMAWKAEKVEFPDVVLSALDGNGFRLTSINGVWVNGRFTWTMEGTQYVK